MGADWILARTKPSAERTAAHNIARQHHEFIFPTFTNRGSLMISVLTVGLLTLVILCTILGNTNDTSLLIAAYYIDAFIFITFLFILSYGILQLMRTSTTNRASTDDDRR